MTIEDKVIAITGASSGIGEGTARLLAARGAKLMIGARRTDRLAALAEATCRVEELDMGDNGLGWPALGPVVMVRLAHLTELKCVAVLEQQCSHHRLCVLPTSLPPEVLVAIPGAVVMPEAHIPSSRPKPRFGTQRHRRRGRQGDWRGAEDEHDAHQPRVR